MGRDGLRDPALTVETEASRRGLRLDPVSAMIGLLAGGAVVSVISEVKILVAHPTQWGIDLVAYVAAANRLLTTGTPYAPELHLGPFINDSAHIPIAYLYPPPLAQLFVPLTAIPMPALAVIWATCQVVILAILLPMVYVRFGGTADRVHVAGLLLAVVAFSPTIVAVATGNVSGWVAVLIAVMLLGRSSATSIAAGAGLWLKLAPGAFTLGAIVDRATRRPAVLAVAAIVGLSFVVSPIAWQDWLAVLPSAGGFYAVAPFAENLAPMHPFDALGYPGVATVVGVLVPASFLALTVFAALRGRTEAWIAAACGVYLAATGTSWDHYFVALVPVAVASWPSVGRPVRWAIVATVLWLGPLRFLDSEVAYHLVALVLWPTVLVGAVIHFLGQASPVALERPASRAVRAPA